MKDLIYTLYDCNFFSEPVFLSPAEVKVVGLPFTIRAAHINYYVVLGKQCRVLHALG